MSMPVEPVIGVLVFSVLVNMALLVWVSRSDHVTLHWPRHLPAAMDGVRSHPPHDELPPVRRRVLFVADQPASRGGSAGDAASNSAGTSTGPMTGVAVPPGRDGRALGHFGGGSEAEGRPLSATLPPDLAEFLSQPAAIAPGVEGFGFAPSGDAPGREVRAAASGPDGQADRARLPQPQFGVRSAFGGSSTPGAPASADHAARALSIDPLTGLEGPESWTRITAIENAKLLRYRRPMTVIMAEVDGLRRLAERLGQEPVDRLLPVIADAFARGARTSDWVARVGEARFGALLPETDEIQAINYVERIRLVCEPWLASHAVPLRLAIGWSSPTSSTDLEYAIRRAEERMHADRRVPGKALQPPRATPARVVSPLNAVDTGGRNGSGGAVSPAETGRVAPWGAAPTHSDEAPGDFAAEVTRARGHRRARSGTDGNASPGR